jgi:hypothetical protein
MYYILKKIIHVKKTMCHLMALFGTWEVRFDGGAGSRPGGEGGGELALGDARGVGVEDAVVAGRGERGRDGVRDLEARGR